MTSLSPKPANTSPALFTSPGQTGSPECEDEPSDPFPSFTPSKLSFLSMKTPDKSLEKAQFLKQSMTKRLSCVDRGWLERCQVFTEVRDEHKPVAGNLDQLENDRIVQSSSRTEKVVVENGKTTNLATPQNASRVSVEKFPVEVDHSSGTADGERKLDLITDDQDGIDASSPPLETRKKPKTARSRKAQGSEGPDYEQKTVRKKGLKRLRESEEGGEQAEQTESVQKKRRTKKEDSAEEKPGKKGRKKKGRGAEAGESSSETKVPEKLQMPQENLLGEMLGEDVKAASSRKKNLPRSR